MDEAAQGRLKAPGIRCCISSDFNAGKEGERLNAKAQLIAIDRCVSRDTVECLRGLLRQAEQGEVVGIAYAAMHRGRHFHTESCGEANRNPAFASAMAGALWFDIQLQLRGEN